MTFDLAEVGLIVGAATMLGGQLAILQQVVRSNRDQGARLGRLEKWREGVEKVAEYKAKRTLSRAHGVPTTEDDTQP